MKNAKTKKTLQIVLNVVIWLFVAFAVTITVLVIAAQSDSDGVPAIGGKCFISILTDSMSPTFNSGDMIVGEKLTDEQKTKLVVDDGSRQSGDIITFYADLDGDGNKEINTHRIVGVNLDSAGNAISYITQGDNKQTNVVTDKDPVLCTNVICRYTGTRLKTVGGVIGFLQTSTGFLVVIVIPLVLFFIYELYRFIVTLKSVRGEGKKTITAEDEELIKQKAIEEYLRQQAEAKAAEEAQKKTNDISPSVAEIKTGAEEAAEVIKSDTAEAAKTAEETVGEVKAEAEEAAKTAEEAAEEKIEEAAETVEEIKEEAAETVAVAEEAIEESAETVEEIKEEAAETAAVAEEAIEESADAAEEAKEKAGE